MRRTLATISLPPHLLQMILLSMVTMMIAPSMIAPMLASSSSGDLNGENGDHCGNFLLFILHSVPQVPLVAVIIFLLRF